MLLPLKPIFGSFLLTCVFSIACSYRTRAQALRVFLQSAIKPTLARQVSYEKKGTQGEEEATGSNSNATTSSPSYLTTAGLGPAEALRAAAEAAQGLRTQPAVAAAGSRTWRESGRKVRPVAWRLRGGALHLIGGAEGSLTVEGSHAWVPCSLSTKDTSSVLELSQGGSLAVQHMLPPNGGGVFTNKYTLILDIAIHGFEEQRFTPLVQTDSRNASFAGLYVRSNGSLGCIRYSQAGVIQPGQWHRIVLTVNTPASEQGSCVAWYVDGTAVGELRHGDVVEAAEGEEDEPTAVTVQLPGDDRWALDNPLYLFTDKAQGGNHARIQVANVQLYPWCGSSDWISSLGPPSTLGVLSFPLRSTVAMEVSKKTRLPYAWCYSAVDQAAELVQPGLRGGMSALPIAAAVAEEWLKVRKPAIPLLQLPNVLRSCFSCVYDRCMLMVWTKPLRPRPTICSPCWTLMPSPQHE